MNINLTRKTHRPRHKKDGRINPHHFWAVFVSVFIIVIILLIVFFTFFFILSSRKLDEPVVPQLETNSAQIRKVENIIKKTEDAVSSRKGQTPASQNTTPIVQ